MNKLIGLHGPMESGKDEVARILAEKYGYTRLSIGRYIRDEVAKGHVPADSWAPDRVRLVLCGMNQKRFQEALHAKPTTPEMRETLQWWGEYRRHKNGQYWNQLLVNEIAEHLKQDKHKFVVTDVRMPAEFNLVEKSKEDGWAGENWMIFRAACVSQLKYGQLHEHPTETALRNYPFKMVIANNGDLKDLERLVDMTVREFGL